MSTRPNDLYSGFTQNKSDLELTSSVHCLIPGPTLRLSVPIKRILDSENTSPILGSADGHISDLKEVIS